MDNRPIGVIDSGVGGLTAVKELHRLLPGEDIIYFGDTGRVPYGSRGKDIIRKYAAQDIAFISSFNVKAVVVACGTISVNFSEQDARDIGITVPYFTVVQPAARSACALTSGGRVGVMATSASIRSGAYGRAMRAISPSVKVFGNAAPLLVPLVENGQTGFDNQITRLTLQMYLNPLIREDIDTLILGCTHYPLLYDIINDMLDYKTTLVDAGAATAREVQAALCEKGLLAEKETGESRYYVTDSVENFTAVAKNFLFENIEASSRYVDIETIDGN